MNTHPCLLRVCVRPALLSVLLLGLLGDRAAAQGVGPETGPVTPSVISSHVPSPGFQAAPVVAAWNWRAYFPDGKFEINQRRVIQIAALAMCLALYIIMWRNK